MIEAITRRDFLKLSASGTLGMALSELGFKTLLNAPPASQGRMVWSGIPLYETPSFKAKQIHLFGLDQIVEIQAEVEGEEGNPFNKAWYQVDVGYTYSGWLQPVETRLQKKPQEIPAGGKLGEICVPLSDTRLDPSFRSKKGYRLYYGSLHWVTRTVVTSKEKSAWYEIYDRETKQTFFVAHTDMRIIENNELSLLSADVPQEEKLIHVDLYNQLVTAFEGEKLVFSSRCSSGGKGTRTPSGEFQTYHKAPSVHMNNQDEDVKVHYDLPGVPWCAFFTGFGNAFHGTYWHNDYGRPRSHGCINLPSEDAKWIYRWCQPTVPIGEDYIHLPGTGTRVKIE